MNNPKDIFRKNCIKQNKNTINKINSYKLKINALEHLKSLLTHIINLKKHKLNILFYISMNNEVPTLKLINEFRKKHNIFVPLIEKESFKMVGFRLPIKTKNFKIKSSNNSILYKKNIDIMIVPIVGMDKKYRRVGFGKGMYDRFFESIKKKPIIVFTQLSECISKENITQQYDITGDYYISAINNVKI